MGGPIAGDPQEGRDHVDASLRRLDAGELEAALDHSMEDMPRSGLDGARRSPEWPETVARTLADFVTAAGRR